jgi:histidinol-phosphate aminotransferase
MAWIKKELKKIGLTYQSSITNFLLIKFPCEKQKTAENAEIFLAKRGILVRNMSGYNLPSYLRVSLGTEEENMIFIKELKSFIDN